MKRVSFLSGCCFLFSLLEVDASDTSASFVYFEPRDLMRQSKEEKAESSFIKKALSLEVDASDVSIGFLTSSEKKEVNTRIQLDQMKESFSTRVASFLESIKEGTNVWEWVLKNEKVKDCWVQGKKRLEDVSKLLVESRDFKMELENTDGMRRSHFYDVTSFFIGKLSLKGELEKTFNELRQEKTFSLFKESLDNFWQCLQDAQDLMNHLKEELEKKFNELKQEKNPSLFKKSLKEFQQCLEQAGDLVNHFVVMDENSSDVKFAAAVQFSKLNFPHLKEELEKKFNKLRQAKTPSLFKKRLDNFWQCLQRTQDLVSRLVAMDADSLNMVEFANAVRFLKSKFPHLKEELEEKFNELRQEKNPSLFKKNLDNFWQCLWQAQDLVDYLVAMDEDSSDVEFADAVQFLKSKFPRLKTELEKKFNELRAESLGEAASFIREAVSFRKAISLKVDASDVSIGFLTSSEKKEINKKNQLDQIKESFLTRLASFLENILESIEEGAGVRGWVLKNQKVKDEWVYAKKLLENISPLLGASRDLKNERKCISIALDNLDKVTSSFIEKLSLKEKLEKKFNELRQTPSSLFKKSLNEFWQYLSHAQFVVNQQLLMNENSSDVELANAVQYLKEELEEKLNELRQGKALSSKEKLEKSLNEFWQCLQRAQDLVNYLVAMDEDSSDVEFADAVQFLKSKFPRLKTELEEKFNELRQGKALSSKEELEEEFNELRQGKALSSKEKLEKGFSEFWQCLWQAQDLVDYLVVMDENSSDVELADAVQFLKSKFPLLKKELEESFDKLGDELRQEKAPSSKEELRESLKEFQQCLEQAEALLNYLVVMDKNKLNGNFANAVRSLRYSFPQQEGPQFFWSELKKRYRY